MVISPESLLESVKGKSILAMRNRIFEISRDLSPEQTFNLSQVLYQYPDLHGAMIGTLLAGHVSYLVPEAMAFLRETVSTHENLHVQDCLAKALDHYCLNQGFDRALPVLEAWSRDPRPFARRASAEAPRPWARKEYFKNRPETAIHFLSALKGDESHYVRFSVGHALAEISRDFPDLVSKELQRWNTALAPVKSTYVFASHNLHTTMGKVFSVKGGHEAAAKS